MRVYDRDAKFEIFDPRGGTVWSAPTSPYRTRDIPTAAPLGLLVVLVATDHTTAPRTVSAV